MDAPKLTRKERLHGYATAMRHEPTLAEQRLWARLRNRGLEGLKFRRQVPVGPYIADFLCRDLSLIVEVDGGQHVDSAYDARRDGWLAEHGWRVLRLGNCHVLEDVESACEHVRLFAAGVEAPPT